jgi:predicted ATPase
LLLSQVGLLAMIMINPINRLESISVKGFRRLRQIDLEMRNLIVAIGANGSGKTSFLDVLSLLAASANGKLQDTLQLKGGLNEILTRGKAQELEIAVSMKVPERQPLKYSLTLFPEVLNDRSFLKKEALNLVN